MSASVPPEHRTARKARALATLKTVKEGSNVAAGADIGADAKAADAGADAGDAGPHAGDGTAGAGPASGPDRGQASERTAVVGRYEVFVSKESFKFNAAHFIAYPGFRERLHGHNYRVSVRIEGPVGADGYVVDFGEIKRAANAVCRQLNERVIIPMQSDVLTIKLAQGQVSMTCQDGTRFSFPESDCALLEIRHSSAEELAAFICLRLRSELPLLTERGVASLQVGVAEAPNQEARYWIDL